ncbi:hypothetical protein NESM_000781400 [Novymonas esmeraldas]|uniref:Uncharacterized protein n=1 Tax=Novymonas esmeraldas TaxID=1808958 RepID=A0AAW0EY89_9TRYP
MAAPVQDAGPSARDDTSAMWDQIQRMPFQQLQDTNDFVYIKKVMTLVARYLFSESDPKMCDPRYTECIGKLLKTVSSKCLVEFERLSVAADEAVAECKNLRGAFGSQLLSKEEELGRLREALRKAEEQVASQRAAADSSGSEELVRLRVENDDLSMQLRGMARRTEELKQALASRSDDKSHINESYDKAQLEYRHLAARYRRLVDRSAKNEDMLEELRRKERGKQQSATDEMDRLRQKVQSLQQDNFALVKSRDRAEELCEKREAEALRDMTELRRLTKDLLDEERAKSQSLRDEFVAVKQESDAHVEQLMHQHEVDLEEKEEEIALLRRQLEKATSKQKYRFHPDMSASTDDSSSRSSATDAGAKGDDGDAKVRVISTDEQRRLERENDDLRAEAEQLELRIDALDEENRRLGRLIKNYESGNEGLYRLRQELADHTRTVEVLQGENAQLRERLNGMEDSVTFNAALRELCKRVGVTEEEINSLRPQNATAYSEMDTLKEELSLLKEEVEWLERERRHWMNKVRLQPLMDTKLRFELGLTSEQLKQLDKLVDQMKAGAVIVEESDESYKDKYFRELQARRRDAEQFNTFVKDRINDALKSAFVDVGAPDTAAAVSALREHIDIITASSSAAETAALAQDKIDRLSRRLEELEQLDKVRQEEVARLREQVVAGTTEREVICRERDQYREAIFGAAGVGAAQPDGGSAAAAAAAASGDPSARALGDFGEVSAGTLSNAKWLTVANTLREQLRVKDTLIDSLNKELASARDGLAERRAAAAEQHRTAELEKRSDSALQDQIKALTELNEELAEKCGALSRVNKDLEDSLERLEMGTTKELLLKVVLLRRREATLLQRLRRALTAQEESTAADRRVQAQVQNTLERLRAALESESPTADAVLPRSSAGCSMESEMLSFLDHAVQHVLQGRLFREDSRFLLHLNQVYHGMEASQAVVEVRLDAKRLRQELQDKQAEADALTAEVAGLRAAAAAANAATTTTATADGRAGSSPSPEYAAAALAKSEAEAATYKQKYALAAKRLEARDREVAQLEGDLDLARHEVVEVRDHVRNILRDSAEDVPATAGLPQSRASAAGGATQLARAEKEVARLKTVNLGLLHHSLDLQSQAKSLELELEARQQEITLLKSSADSQVVTSFVSAAIREHAALRRQSELALIHAKRLKMQLAATEANYHVVANEATVYKLGAYRLYRKYVEQVVAVVDYLRCVQRASKGSLSPHQAEIMDRRLRKAVADLAECFGRGKMLAMQLSDAQNTVATLDRQLSLLHMEDGPAKRDAVDARLQEARSRVREHDRLMTECQEERQFLQAKLNRAEATNKDLNAEVARLEYGYMSASPLDAELLATLLQLKESVFDKAVAPTSVPPIDSALAPRRLGSGGADDGDVAVREYKGAVLRQAELAQQCATLKRQMADLDAERRRAEHATAQLREEAQQATEQAAFAQRQVEEERQKTAQREARLLRAHETQSAVARRATEHNVQCLQEMIQKKEQQISSLQEQLSTERRKHVEHELGEAVRMERLHEHMFRENTAMVERFKSAIETVGDSMRHAGESATPALLASGTGSGSGGGGGGAQEQLQLLTAETVRLRQELKEARTSIIVLESQVEQQVQQLLSTHAPVAGGAGAASAAATSPGATVASAHNTDALMGIIRNQTAMVESLRQRETQLSTELQREREQRVSLERQLGDVRNQQVEQGGMLQLLSQVTSAGGVSDAPLVAELRAQKAAVDQELCVLRQTLEEERAYARRFQADAAEWKAHLDALKAEVSGQQVDVERAQHLAALNEGLRVDLTTVREQNDKLVLAATVLKQRLMDEAHRSGESARQHQQEIALAQRMGTIQQESAGHMKALDHRIRAIQKELNERVEREKSMLEKNTESQRLVYQLHQQLRAKDRELATLQEQLRLRNSSSGSASPAPSPAPALAPAPHRSGSAAAGVESRGTQVLASARGAPPSPPAPPPGGGSTGDAPVSGAASSRAALALVSAQDALLQPQIVGIVQREVQRQQRDNVAEISTLRSRVHRLEKDANDAEEQLRGEREASRQLRTQLRQLRDEQGRKDTEHAAQLTALHRQSRTRADPRPSEHRTSPEAVAPPPPVSPTPPVAEDRSHTLHSSEVVLLREQVATLEARVRRYEQELEEIRATRDVATAAAGAPAPPAGDGALPSSPADVRAHVVEVRRLEGIIDGLRRRISVDAPAREGEWQRRVAVAEEVQRRMAADIATLRGIPLSDVASIYATTATSVQQTVDELRMELLHKSNTILDLRFTVETMELQMSRMQRHLDDILAVDAAAAHSPPARAAGAVNVETLTNVIDNLKLVIAKLQSENGELRSAQALSARYARQSRQLHELQERERSLQAQLQSFSRLLVGARGSSRGDGGSAVGSMELHRRLATAQAAAEQYEADLNDLRLRLSDADHRAVHALDPSSSSGAGGGAAASPPPPVALGAHSAVPPPLPTSRFSQRHGGRTSSLAGVPQRRLSSTRTSEADATADEHSTTRRYRPQREEG